MGDKGLTVDSLETVDGELRLADEDRWRVEPGLRSATGGGFISIEGTRRLGFEPGSVVEGRTELGEELVTVAALKKFDPSFLEGKSAVEGRRTVGVGFLERESAVEGRRTVEVGLREEGSAVEGLRSLGDGLE